MFLTYGNININGLASSLKNENISFETLIRGTRFDLYFIQETRIETSPELIKLFDNLGYFLSIYEGEHKGRCGVGVLVKNEYKNQIQTFSFSYPISIRGRVMVLNLQDSYFFNLYLPHTSNSNCENWSNKIEIVSKVITEVSILLKAKKKVFICGDFNLIGKTNIKNVTDYTGFFYNQITHGVKIKLNPVPELFNYIKPMIDYKNLIFQYDKNSKWNISISDGKIELNQKFEESDLPMIFRDCNNIRYLCSLYDVIPEAEFTFSETQLAPEPTNHIKNFQPSFIQTSVLSCFESVLPKIPLVNDSNVIKRVDHIFSNTDTVAFIDKNLQISDHPFIYGLVRL